MDEAEPGRSPPGGGGPWPRTARELALRVGGVVEGSAEARVGRLRAPEDAQPGDLVVVWRGEAPAGTVLVAAAEFRAVAGHPAVVRVEDPRAAFHQLLGLFAPREQVRPSSPLAVVEAGAELGEGVVLGPFAVVGAGARVGAGTVLGSHVSVGPGALIGSFCRIEDGVRIDGVCVIGDRVRVGANSVLGRPGFGHEVVDGVRRSLPAMGGVWVGEGTEIGALVTVDRGTLGDTVIGRDVRIDSQVHVGHNVRIGDGAVVAGQTGISGSARIGPGAVLGGQVGVADHRVIGSGAVVLGRGGVTRDVPAGGVVGGFPARPRNQWRREEATLRRLARGEGRD